MALSNAEKQKRWRDKRNALAAWALKQKSGSQSDEDVGQLKARIRELEARLMRLTTVPAKKSAASKSDPKNRIKHDVKFCGTIIWPDNYLTEPISYPDLKAGWHLAHHWLMHLEHATPQKPNEILTAVMHLCQDIKAADSINGLCDVMTACIAAYAKRNGRKDRADMSGCVPPGLAR